MLWTAFYFLVLLALGCWYLFELYFPSKRLKSPYYSPSNAVIDQVLPDEILEHVMTFLDCQTVLNCRSVSKHWKYQASKETVLKDVLYNQIRYNRRNFSERLTGPAIKIEWLEYNGAESLENQLRDHASAAAQGTKLLELTGTSLLLIKNKLQAELSTPEWAHEFLLKIVSIRGHSDHLWDFQQKPGAFKSVNIIGTLPRIKPRFKERFYMFMDLFDYLSSIRDIKALYIRRARYLPKVAGFIPTTWDMPPVFILYLMAVLFHDYWTSQLELGFWIGLLMYILTIFFCVISIGRLSTRKLRIRSRVFAALYILVLPILIYKHYIRFCQFKSALLFMLTCYVLQENLKTSNILKKKHFYMIVATIVTLFVLVLDWMVILEKLADGTLWRVMLLNAIHYIGICWEVIWINFVHAWADSKHPTFRDTIFKWERSIVVGMMQLSISIIIASLYYPAL